jgi:uncharacterized protein
LSPSVYLILACVFALAAFVQGASGLGFALVATPVLGFLQPALLPGTTLALMIPLNAYVAFREWGHIDRPGVFWITLGRLPGIVGGALLLAAIPVSHLNLLVGVATLLAALVSIAAPSFQPRRSAMLGVGAVTGVVETATGVGGPPLALLYQHRPTAMLRSTVAMSFLVGEVLSLAVLITTGQTHREQFVAAMDFLPAVIFGALASHFVHRYVSGPRVRVGVLGFAVLSGLSLLVKV